MGQFIEFLPRQALVGNSSGSEDIRTNVVDVSDYDKLDIEAEAYTFSGTGSIVCQIETTKHPCMSGFSGITPTVSLSGTGPGSGTGLSPERFVRAKITIPANVAAMVSLRGRAYDS